MRILEITAIFEKEQRTLHPLVGGSSPPGPTMYFACTLNNNKLHIDNMTVCRQEDQPMF